jgi:hypothetical protein
MNPKKQTRLALIVLMMGMFLSPGCGSASTPTATASPEPSETPTQTAIPLPTSTPTPELRPGFLAGGKPFRFVGVFIPGWYWSEWSEANDVALITEAKQAGISVLHVMFPDYEYPLGTFHESELVKLDHFMDTAYQNGIYVMGSFVHGYGITYGTSQPFYDPYGVGGLIDRPEYRSGFKTHMEQVVSRVNTINGRKYSEDPTILAWMLIEEILSAPWNYPNGLPDITATELRDWVEENAAYLKSLDPNHLVTFNTGSGLSNFSDMHQRWQPIVYAPSLDFVELEDAEARILLYPEMMFHFNDMYAIDKPIVQMLSYSGGDIDQEKYCTDYQWQSETMKQVADLYLERGAAGINIFSWRASTVTSPEYDHCYSYDITNTYMTEMIKAIAAELGELNTPPMPLEFVTLGK